MGILGLSGKSRARSRAADLKLESGVELNSESGVDLGSNVGSKVAVVDLTLPDLPMPGGRVMVRHEAFLDEIRVEVGARTVSGAASGAGSASGAGAGVGAAGQDDVARARRRRVATWKPVIAAAVAVVVVGGAVVYAMRPAPGTNGIAPASGGTVAPPSFTAEQQGWIQRCLDLQTEAVSVTGKASPSNYKSLHALSATQQGGDKLVMFGGDQTLALCELVPAGQGQVLGWIATQPIAHPLGGALEVTTDGTGGGSSSAGTLAVFGGVVRDSRITRVAVQTQNGDTYHSVTAFGSFLLVLPGGSPVVRTTGYDAKGSVVASLVGRAANTTNI